MPPNFLLFSLRPPRCQHWVESQNHPPKCRIDVPPPAPNVRVVPQAPVPDPPTDDPNRADDPIADEGEIVEEQIAIVGEIAEDHFSGHPPVGAIPFTVFNEEGAIENVGDFILVGSDESPPAQMYSPL